MQKTIDEQGAWLRWVVMGRSEALVAFAVLITEQKVVRVSAPVAKKIANPFVDTSGSA
jgi:hypothetical protein